MRALLLVCRAFYHFGSPMSAVTMPNSPMNVDVSMHETVHAIFALETEGRFAGYWRLCCAVSAHVSSARMARNCAILRDIF